MVCDEDEWQPEPPRRSLFWHVVAAFVLAILTLGWVWSATAATADVLLIVDGEGNTLLRCKLPTTYLLPPAKAIVCEQAPIHHDGFEP